MSTKITADWSKLMNQSSSTVGAWMSDIAQTVRAFREEDYTEAEMASIVELTKVAAMDFIATAIGVAADKLSSSIERAMETADL